MQLPSVSLSEQGLGKHVTRLLDARNESGFGSLIEDSISSVVSIKPRTTQVVKPPSDAPQVHPLLVWGTSRVSQRLQLFSVNFEASSHVSNDVGKFMPRPVHEQGPQLVAQGRNAQAGPVQLVPGALAKEGALRRIPLVQCRCCIVRSTVPNDEISKLQGLALTPNELQNLGLGRLLLENIGLREDTDCALSLWIYCLRIFKNLLRVDIRCTVRYKNDTTCSVSKFLCTNEKFQIYIVRDSFIYRRTIDFTNGTSALVVIAITHG